MVTEKKNPSKNNFTLYKIKILFNKEGYVV